MNVKEGTALHLKVGDWVEVKAPGEILATLDVDGSLDGIPYMPEMAAFCGRRLRVFRRAHKSCDTIQGLGGLKVMAPAVHLDGARCSGDAHGGCHNSCVIFWHEGWLRRAEGTDAVRTDAADAGAGTLQGAAPGVPVRWCYKVGPDVPSTELRYRCQATETPRFTQPLSPWQVSQYVEDLQSGNIDVKELLAGATHSAYRGMLGMGFGYRIVVASHDWVQKRRGGIPNPYINGTLTKTPVATLDLQVGELVRIKPFEEIMATLDRNNKNRGLWFVPQEMGRFCGRTARVVKRVDRLLSERTGEMLTMKTAAVVLDNIYCTGRTVDKRVFCPRASALFWREIWLERVGPDVAQGPEVAVQQTSAGRVATDHLPQQ